jgi:predicted transcriptional regulator
LSLQIERKLKQEKDGSRIDWRRSKVQELSSQGHSQREIAQILQVSNGTVNRDLSYLRQQAKYNIKRYIDEILPEEYEKCLVGLTAILREAWNTSQQAAEDKREKIQALSLAKECYSMKLELLTNAMVVDDAIRFVSESEKSKDKDREQVKRSSSSTSPSYSSGNEDDDKESMEPDYGEDENSKEGEVKQEEQTGEITTTTVNTIF